MKLNHFVIIFLLLVITSCEKKIAKVNSYKELPNYEIMIENFYGSEGEIFKWLINKDSIKVIYNCDFEDCKDTLLFSESIDTATSKLYYNKLIDIPLNKLNKEYDKFGLKDGLFENIKIKNVFKDSVSVQKHGVEKNEIKDLYLLTNKLLLKKTKFKINK